MDRAAQYSELIVKAIQETNHYRFPGTEPNIDTLFLRDEINHQFMLYRAGWIESHPAHSVVISARVKEGKIWIDED